MGPGVTNDELLVLVGCLLVLAALFGQRRPPPPMTRADGREPAGASPAPTSRS